jgi:hypothetical protein
MPSTTVAAAFTRRHFEAVADAIDGAREGFEADGACMFAVEVVADSLAALFAEDNPRFKRDRFLAACGIEGQS